MTDLRSYIRHVQDFPKPGIGFKDITTLLMDGRAWRAAVNALCEPYRRKPPDIIVGIEARGFIVGGAMALEMDVGFVPIRKPGKLPYDTISESYALEYGTDTIEMHKDAVTAGQRVLLVDDLLATGGTAAAAAGLIRKTGAEIIGAAFLIELSFLPGREKLKDIPLHVLIDYDSE